MEIQGYMREKKHVMMEILTLEMAVVHHELLKTTMFAQEDQFHPQVPAHNEKAEHLLM